MTTAPALLADLRRAGVDVDDVWTLVNENRQYDAAIPVLLDWLEHLDSRVSPAEQSSLREGLVRALTTPSARPVAAPIMVDQFRRVDDPSGLGLRWVIGNALSVVADDSVFVELESLLRDSSYGRARQMVALALGQSKNPHAASLLVELLADEDVAAHALMSLGKLKAPGTRPAVEAMLDHPQALLRREAKKALAKLPPA